MHVGVEPLVVQDGGDPRVERGDERELGCRGVGAHRLARARVRVSLLTDLLAYLLAYVRTRVLTSRSVSEVPYSRSRVSTRAAEAEGYTRGTVTAPWPGERAAVGGG